MGNQPDIRAGRLPDSAYAENFSDVHPPLDRKAALVEASRCYFCYDAPCIEACPTGIDIPSFIRKIGTGNVRGAAQEIFQENILGGACARVCPTEVLCQQACVRNAQEAKPVQIGLLQRYATDAVMDSGVHPFSRAEPTGRKVAVIGAGPAGLACAHRLALRGPIEQEGTYPLPEAQLDRFLLQIDVDYPDRASERAILLATTGVEDAVAYIAKLRQAKDLGALPVGRKVVVIGGGNTAIDIAVQTKRLGAEDVTLVYRRGPEAMSAPHHEQEFAQVSGVKL